LEEQEFISWWAITRHEVGKRLAKYREVIRSVRDLEQDVASIAWEKKDSFSDPDFFRRWIVQKAEWLALDELRSSRRAREVFSQMEEGIEGKVGLTQERRVVLREIAEAIGKLPPQQRAVVKGMFEGKTETQLAQELNIKEATVRSLRRFGRMELLRLLTTTQEGHGHDNQ
jgi:RNA polymerase sigma factor (sigma-70 family)